MEPTTSPYLASPTRLADVVAAIQAAATYKYYQLSFEKWAQRISGADDPETVSHWRSVFQDHPEFFRLEPDGTRGSLVWRRQYPKRYHVDREEKVSHEEWKELKAQGKDDRISRMPLGAGEIAILVQTAVNLHSRALEHRRDRRWWIPVLAGVVGIALGAAIQAKL